MPVLCRWWNALVALCLFPSPVFAQEPEKSAGAEEEPQADEVRALPETLRGAPWEWQAVGPASGWRFSSVAIHPQEEGVFAAASLDGRVWVTADAGESWIVALGSLLTSLGGESGDEDVLLNVEALIEEIVGNVEDPTQFSINEDEDEISVDEIEDLARDAAEQVRVDLRADPWFLAQRAVLRGERTAARPKVWFGPQGKLFVGRADGLHATADLGGSWRKVIEEPVHALAYLPSRKLFIAGTPNGTRYSTAGMGGDVWIDPDDDTDGLHIFDLVATEAGVFAGTERGLYLAPNAQSWTSRGLLEEPVVVVEVDPSVPDRVWMVTESRLLVSDDGGRSAVTPTGWSPRDTRDLLFLGGQHILAAGRDGPWESTDGGSAWVPVPRGLVDVASGGLARDGETLLIAAESGVYRLMPVTERELSEEHATRISTGWIPVEQLLQAAIGRDGVRDIRRGSRALLSAIPSLLVEGAYTLNPSRLSYRSGTRTSAGLDGGTSLDRDGLFYLTARLVWTPAGRKGSQGSSGQSTSSQDQLYVIIQDGEVFVDSGETPQVMAARVSRRGLDLRNTLISVVTELYYSREGLVLLRPSVAKQPVRERVEHELKIQELEARLDMLTSGAVRRWSDKEDG